MSIRVGFSIWFAIAAWLLSGCGRSGALPTAAQAESSYQAKLKRLDELLAEKDALDARYQDSIEALRKKYEEDLAGLAAEVGDMTARERLDLFDDELDMTRQRSHELASQHQDRKNKFRDEYQKASFELDNKILAQRERVNRAAHLREQAARRTK